MGHLTDATDRKIIALLLANGRLPSLEIARQIGVVEGTVRKRLERLLAEGVLRVVAAVDHEALGYATHALFHVQVDLARLEAVGRQLADRPQIVAVWQSTGGSELVAEAVFESDRELVRFLQETLAPLPGVGRVETTHLVRALKRHSQWRLPSQPGPAGLAALAAPAGQPNPASQSRLAEEAAVRDQPSQSPAILVVDDDPIFLETTRAVLESRGYRVSGARNGEEGLRAMRQCPPDLVILDIMMSYTLDGLQLSRTMGEDDALRDVPILMVSSLPATEHAGEFPTDEHLRAADFLTKPVAPATLLARVERVLADSPVRQ